MVRAFGAVMLALLATSAAANELIVDRYRIQMNDLVTITLTLEGDFAGEEVNIPLKNLAFVGEPSVSSEFAWFNGQVTRRKVFRYRARPLAPGRARVGPLVLVSSDGQRETLRVPDIDVQPDRTSQSNDAEVVLRELLAAGRDPVFVVGEIDKASAFVGEPVTVTWWLYNAAVIQQWQIAAVPKLAEFWAEEQARSDTPERVFVNEMMVQRLPVRRVVLFPLQSGPLRVDGVTVQAAILRRSRRGPFAMFEGDLTETTFTSAPMSVDVKPLPAGPPIDAIGELALACEPAVQKNGGPVVVRVTLSGLGNLRAATAPRFQGAVPGTVQIEGGEVAVSRELNSFAMSRHWRYLVFPERSGLLTLPPLSMRIFDPKANARRDLQCATAFVNAVDVQPPLEAPLPPVTASARPLPWPWIGGALAVLLAIVIAVPRVRRELALRREVREITRDASPSEIRARMEARVHIDMREASERGDAWRALRSLLEAAERDRDIAVDAEQEIARRVRDVLDARR